MTTTEPPLCPSSMRIGSPVRCSHPHGHPPIARSGTYYQHAHHNSAFWNDLMAARCGTTDEHDPHVTSTRNWCAGRPLPARTGR